MDTRAELYDALYKELIGPGNTKSVYLIENIPEREVLLAKIHGAPHKRYGAGMLYPRGISNTLIEDGTESKISGNGEIGSLSSGKSAENSQNGNSNFDELHTDDPVSMANSFKPSALGITFRVGIGANIDLNIRSAHYKPTEERQVYKKDNEGNIMPSFYTSGERSGQPILSDAWERIPISKTISPVMTSDNCPRGLISKETIHFSGEEEWLGYKIFNRSSKEDKQQGILTLTVVLENLIEKDRSDKDFNRHILFQNEVTIKCGTGFVPLVEKENKINEEVNQMNLLYRNKKGYAIGHGVAVEWSDSLNPVQLKSNFLPKYELPVISSNESAGLILSMHEMSDRGNWEVALDQIKKLIIEYEKWINGLENEISYLDKGYYINAANQNRKKCLEVLRRIKKGYQLLSDENNSDIIKCFRWMNRSMLWQQQRSKVSQRKWIKKGSGETAEFKLEPISKKEGAKFESLKEFSRNPRKGKWRPFQLAFVLMNIKSIVYPLSEERKIVDLIWFPTGGGKTEAYLGLSAFNIFWRRLQGNKLGVENVSGTSIIMRYTLRLLTSQQFERASSLICACDLIRQEVNERGPLSEHLGSDPITIGLWVGGDTTPNKGSEAIGQYNQLIKYNRAAYNFIVLKCPCCGGQIGKLSQRTGNQKIKGLSKNDRGKIEFICENPDCEYSSKKLPIDIVDEYLFENPPTLLLGTVDKFAMVPWKPNSGALFGFRTKNEKLYRILPPDLIIQDELHLISGPLGSVVGMYETMIQTLCNQYENKSDSFLPDEEKIGDFIPPKIVASTATISRAQDQVKALYATNKMCLFPPQAVEFGNTWFSEITNAKGRQYVGVCTPGYPSPQTSIVRTYASVLQKVKLLQEKDDVNYYWTLLGYFNSIRELGGAVSLVEADIVERLGQLFNRELLDSNQRRFIKYKELTSRVSSSEIPAALKELEVDYNKNSESRAVGICLATNMIATGVDISRFGLMCIHGQPKTTAEYIQASSRVGRDPSGPGLVLTLYNSNKPRDKSQYEHFLTYHSRIYGSVEPTSVTPFTINVREKALHAIVIGLIRLFSSTPSLRTNANTNHTDFDKVSNIISKVILERIQTVNPDELQQADLYIQSVIEKWRGQFQYYGDAGNYKISISSDFTPLMYASSAEVPLRILQSNSFKTPTSMRGTDSESNIKRITDG